MRLTDIREHFVSRAGWVDPEQTVDQIIAGDPQQNVQTCLVTWISSFHALRTAVEQGVDLLITHEPTFYLHRGESSGQQPETDWSREKRAFLEESGLAILRLHDTWDRWPEIGIPWAWAKFLGLSGAPVATTADGDTPGFQHRYDISPTSAGAFAEAVAARTATIGEPAVQVTGNPEQTVSKIGIGTGCGCSIAMFREMGCDVSVVCDDGSCYWRDIQWAEDDDHAVVRVNHGTSEEPGMVTLTRYVNENLEDVTAKHLPHGPTFTLMAAPSSG